MTRILFASDLHGNLLGYDHVFRIAGERGIDALIFGGDLTPKKLAIKLKDRELQEPPKEDEEPLFEPGEVIPLDVLRSEGPAQTYTRRLRHIGDLNRRYTPSVLATLLNQRGYIIHPADTAFYDFPSMLDDQLTIDELFRFFSILTPGERLQHPITLTEHQRTLCLDDVFTNLREIEEDISDNQRAALATRYYQWLNPRGTPGSFHAVALSTNLPLYFTYKDKLDALKTQRAALAAAITTDDPVVRERITHYLDAVVNDVERAIRLVTEVYDTTFIQQLARRTVAHKFKEEHGLTRKPELYAAGQREFFLTAFRSRLEAFKRAHPDIQVYAILGNDDLTEVEPAIQSLHDTGLLTYLNTAVVPFDDTLTLAGYPFVSHSAGQFYDGWEKQEPAIAKDLEHLATTADPKKTIFVIHTPAHGGKLDVNYRGEHVGSTAVQAFVERHQPFLVLSGHVHESFQRTGAVMEMIGNTPCYNPGSRYGSRKCTAVIIDTCDPAQFERIFTLPSP